MAIAHNGEVELYYEVFGEPANPALVLINGLGSQCIHFDLAFCQQFVDRGFYVVRFDNRDVGLSTKFSKFNPDFFAVMQALERGLDPVVAYRIPDMANDVVAVLDDLGLERVHVAGWSLGGMIAQQLAIDHADRLLSLSSNMSTTGDPDVGQPSAEAAEIIYGASSTDRASIIKKRQQLERAIGSPAHYDPERIAQQTGRAYDRCFDLAGVARQLGAIFASGSRSAALGAVTVPSLVIHGDADRLIDLSGGVRTADSIPNARLEVIQGMGHDLSPFFWDQLVTLMAEHADAASS